MKVSICLVVTLFLTVGLQKNALAENYQSNSGRPGAIGRAEIKLRDSASEPATDSGEELCESKSISNNNDFPPYVGNSSSMKFHQRNCEFARVMAASRQVPFQNRQQAIEAGMKPCNWCMPTWWTQVQGRLILPIDQAGKFYQSSETSENSHTSAAPKQ